MEVQVLGAGDAFGSGGRFNTCFLDKPVKFHLDYATLVRHLPGLGVKRVILTHMSPDLLARAEEVGYEVADDGMVISL